METNSTNYTLYMYVCIYICLWLAPTYRTTFFRYCIITELLCNQLQILSYTYTLLKRALIRYKYMYRNLINAYSLGLPRTLSIHQLPCSLQILDLPLNVIYRFNNYIIHTYVQLRICIIIIMQQLIYVYIYMICTYVSKN